MNYLELLKNKKCEIQIIELNINNLAPELIPDLQMLEFDMLPGMKTYIQTPKLYTLKHPHKQNTTHILTIIFSVFNDIL